MVVCQPGTTEVAKSKDTTVCTDNTSGVLKPASTNERLSCRCQCLVDPVHPNDNNPYIYFLHFNLARSRTVARSGIKPEYQNNNETVKYVEIANTSHNKWRVEVYPKRSACIGIRKYKESHPHTTHMPDRELTRAHYRKDGHRFSSTVHPCSPTLAENKRIAEISVPA